jgi:hypothetical protein
MLDDYKSHLASKNVGRLCALVMAFLYFIVRPCVGTDAAASALVSPQLSSLHGGSALKDLKEIEAYIVVAEENLKAHEHASKEEIELARSRILGGLQAEAFAQSRSGNSVGAIKTFNRESALWNEYHGSASIGDMQADLTSIDSSVAINAIDAIVEAAKSRQVVILNEAHHVGYDRVFAMRLARELRKIGYEYLACETFTTNDNSVLSDGYVSGKTGYFSSEPMYVGFLADAISDGWKFVSYESDGLNNTREYDMAANLVGRIFSKNPHAKVFIYAGYSHAEKAPVSRTNSDGSKMAAQLKRLTGIDPITINQTSLYDHYDSDQQEKYYEHALSKLHGTIPVVLVNEKGRGVKLSMDGMAYDFEVVHPRYGIDARTGRPSWMGVSSMGGLMPRDIPKNLLPIAGRRLIYAYRSNSPKDAAPFDVVMVKAGERAPKLMLPAGDFSFEYED